MKKHDERSVLAQLKLQWQAEIDYGKKVVRIPVGSPLSIHICGKIDYLEHYCGWRVMFTTKKQPKNKKNHELD
jgi:hypothetical protein